MKYIFLCNLYATLCNIMMERLPVLIQVSIIVGGKLEIPRKQLNETSSSRYRDHK